MSDKVILSKGERVSLAKHVDSDGNLVKMQVELGWSENPSANGVDYDVDVSCLGCSEGKVMGNKCYNDRKEFIGYDGMVWYHKEENGCGGAVNHTGDVLDGSDVERINFDLSKIDVDKYPELIIPVSIHEAEERKQTFGLIENTYLKVSNLDTGSELLRYDITENMSAETAMIAAKFYFKDNEWKFAAIGQAVPGGFAALLKQHGVDVE